jgi:branched-chain amino acid transport system ATP-binding protein
MLDLTGINTYYGDSHILQGVDLHIPAGKAVGLLGRNGMGKTTLIRSLMGYVPMAGGKAVWNDRDVTGWPPEKMARLGIGYVPEGRGIFPNLSVRETCDERTRRRRRPRAWTYDRVLATFPAPDRAARQRRRNSCRAASSRCCRSAAR